MVRRLRCWLLRRRLNKILDELGWPAEQRVVFSGSVKMDEVRFKDEVRHL